MRPQVIYPELMKYTNKKGTFIATYTGVHLQDVHPYINSYRNTPSMLLQNLYSVEDNQFVARYYWMNWNRSWEKQNLKPGDIVEFKCNSVSYFAGREHHRLSPCRVPREIFRLVYPSDIQVIGHDDIQDPLDKPVVDLRTGEEYNSFNEYYRSNVKSNSNEEKELRLISLIDGETIDLLLNRNGHVNCRSYPPLVMFKDTFDKLTNAERAELVDVGQLISTPPSIIDY